jgi:hypothetical protein
MVASKCTPHRVQARDVTALSPWLASLLVLFKYPDTLLTDVLKHPEISSQLRSNLRMGALASAGSLQRNDDSRAILPQPGEGLADTWYVAAT